ncbi:MAG: hypothetical protein ACRDL6_05695 [Solirubrobacterales bacterium]
MRRPPVGFRGLLGAAALLGLLAALASPAAAQAADTYVDFETGDDTLVCTDPDLPCQTIQAGINKATVGATVRVDDTAGNADSSIGLNLDMGKSLIAQEFGPDGDENALPEPDTIIDAGETAVGFPAIRVPSTSGGGTIQGFVIRSPAQPVSLQATTTLTGNRIDEDAGLGSCMIGVSGSGNNSVVGQNTIVDPTPAASPKAGVCITASATPSVDSNAFTDLNHGVQSAGGNSTISSNVFRGTQGTTSDAAIEVTSGSALEIASNLIEDPGDTFVGGILLRQTGASPVVGASLRQNTILGHRFGVVVNDTEALVSMIGNLIAKSTNSGLAMNDTEGDDGGNVFATNVTITDSTNAEVSVTNADLTLNSGIIGAAGINASGLVMPSCTITFSRGPSIMASPSGCANFQTTAAPGFLNPAIDDYHLAVGSAMIDRGDPATPAAGTLDLDGQARATDGNGDGIVRRDIGADETPTGLPPGVNTPPAALVPAPQTTAKTQTTAKKKCKKKRKKKGKKGAAAAAKRKGCKKKRKKRRK